MRGKTIAVREGDDPFSLADEAIERLACHRTVSRGLAYARDGRVERVFVVSSTLHARVRGGRAPIYDVAVRAQAGRLLPTCTCPYDDEPFCKHAVASLVVWNRRRREGAIATGDASSDAILQARGLLARAEGGADLLDLRASIVASQLTDAKVATALRTAAGLFEADDLDGLLAEPGFAGWLADLGLVDRLVEALRRLSVDLARPEIAPLPREPEALLLWARRLGLSEVLERPLSVLLPWSNGLLVQAVRWSDSDLTVHEGLSGGRLPPPFGRRPYREDLCRAARAYLGAHAAEKALEARRAEAWATPPSEPGMRALRDRLFEDLEVLRSRSDGASTRSAAVVEAELSLDPDEPALVLRGKEHGRYYPFEARLALSGFEVGPLRRRCSCAARRPQACPHELLLVEGALDAIHDTGHGLRAALAEATAKPTWHRFLEAVAGGLDRVEATRSAPPRRLVWRLEGPPGDPRVRPVVQDALKGGRWSKGRALGVVEAFNRPELLSPQDGAVLVPLALGHVAGAGRPEHVVRALEALEGHPNVLLGSREARVEVLRPALEVVAGADDLEVMVALGEARLSAKTAALHRVGDDALVYADAGARAVFVCRLEAGLRALLDAAARHPARVPRTGEAALMQTLAPLRDRVEIRLPDRLRGKERPADSTPVVRLDPRGDLALEVRLLVRPLPGAEPRRPGGGPAEAHALTTGGRPTWARRDLGAERRLAAELWSRLGLPDSPEAEPFGAVLEGPDEVLDLVGALGELGEAVRVEWPEGVTPWSVRHASASDLRVRVQSAGVWFGVEGEVEVDGVAVPLGALLEAVRTGKRFVPIGPGRFARIAEGLRSRLARADELLVPRKAGRLAVGVAHAEGLAGLLDGIGELEADRGWVELLARIASSREHVPALPAGLTAELRPYQREGFEWLSRLSAWDAGCCLADDMGLGKTVQTLAVLLERRDRGPALVVAPTSVGQNWIEEARRFAPSLRAALYRGPGREALLESLGSVDLLVTSYGILALDVEALAAVEFGTLVLDEAQAIKNARSRRAAAARRLRAPFRIALSGTPIENHLGELWSLFHTVSPGFLGPWSVFRERFARPIEVDGDVGRREALARLVRPFLLRRSKAQVAPELPERSEVLVPVLPSPAERRGYDEARREAIEMLARGGGPSEEKRIEILSAITRLRRLACHPRLVDPSSTLPSAKLEAALELVSRVVQGPHRALVFSQFTGHLALLREALDERGVSYLYLDGKTPAATRARLVSRWQEGEGALFLISLKAGGTGLNLTGADTVLHLDPWWNPAVEDQATDRAHRIGQTRPVTVARLVTQGTIEEAVVALHAQKRDLAQGLLDGTDRAGRLTSEELAELLRFGEDEPDPEDGYGELTDDDDPEPTVREAGRALSVRDLRALVDAFEAALGEDGAEGHRYSSATVKSYARAAARFVGFAERAELERAERGTLEEWAALYLDALESGRFEAPRSEPALAKTVLRHLAELVR